MFRSKSLVGALSHKLDELLKHKLGTRHTLSLAMEACLEVRRSSEFAESSADKVGRLFGGGGYVRGAGNVPELGVRACALGRR
jgi:hypothetical protein